MTQVIELKLLQKLFEIKPNKTWSLFVFRYTDTRRDSLLKPYGGGNASLQTNGISLKPLAKATVWCFVYKKRNYSGMSVTVNKGWVGFLLNVKNLLSSIEVKTKGSTSNSNNMEEIQISIRRRNMCIYLKYLDLNLKDMHLYCLTWALLWNVLLLTGGLNGSVIFWPGLGSHADLFCNLQSAFEVFVQQQLLKRFFLLCACD